MENQPDGYGDDYDSEPNQNNNNNRYYDEQKQQSNNEGYQQDTKYQIREDDEQIDIKLFVGQIPKSWIQNDVKDFFSKYGDIIEAQIIRDNQRNHKGCAFVKFRSLTEAQNAIEQLKNNKIQGMSTAIQIRWADGEWQRLGVPQNCDPRLFIGSLPKQCTKEWLIEPFSQFGQYTELSIMVDTDGVSKGSGFIQYKHLQSAIRAIRKLNAQLVFQGYDSHPVEVRFAQSDKPHPPMPKPQPYPQTNKPSLPIFHQYFTPSPENRPYYLNTATNQTQFQEPPMGATVYRNGIQNDFYIQQMNYNQPIPDHIVQRLNYTKPEATGPKQQNVYVPGPNGANLFIFHLPNISDEHLREIFSQCGQVLSTRVMRKPDGQSQGFGFVSYTQPQNADKALQTLNGFAVEGKRLKISHKKGDDGMGQDLGPGFNPL